MCGEYIDQQGRPRSEAKECHSLVHICAMCVHARKGAACVRATFTHEPISDFPLPLSEGAVQFVTSLLKTRLLSQFLTPSLRRPYIHAIFCSTACRTACKHAFRFLRVLPEAVSTRHSWMWQTLDDVYTRRCFSESEGTRFGAPGQKALPSVNEFPLLWIFA